MSDLTGASMYSLLSVGVPGPDGPDEEPPPDTTFTRAIETVDNDVAALDVRWTR